MGMAASQARYLALTARKTNTEWEGQQINQARTALANQSANLFNQLLNMEVPNPPKETDYTELQYSYSDGATDSVIEKWDQLSNRDGDYNYAVTHYYMAEIFAGAKKQLQDPQVQIGDVLKKLSYDPSTTTVKKDGADGIIVTYKVNNYPYDQEYDKKITQDMVDSDEKLRTQLISFETAVGLAKADGTLNTDAVYGYEENGVWHFFVANEYNKITEAQAEADPELKKALEKFEIENDLIQTTIPLTYDDIYGSKSSSGIWSFVVKEDDNVITEAKVNSDEALKMALTKYETENNLLDPEGNLTYDNIYGSKDKHGQWSVVQATDANKITEEKANSDLALKQSLTMYELENDMAEPTDTLVYDGIYGYKNSDNTWHFEVNKSATTDNYIKAYDDIDYSTVSDEPSYVGNSKLTELDKLIADKERGIDQVSELAQILRDCPTDSINKYVSFDGEGNLIYEGHGIYTFELNGNTYYTTRADLDDCVKTAKSINDIDAQARLNYYHAGYITKKIEETNNALLETDGKGRFTTVKFDNDSLVYHLNVEEVTNEAAYQDAMNQYLYKKAQYEKTIADINAKTSIIQKEDRTLELRLKQLDTEQNALATEMDAVKKVIKDNVEKTFKTFSD